MLITKPKRLRKFISQRREFIVSVGNYVKYELETDIKFSKNSTSVKKFLTEMFIKLRDAGISIAPLLKICYQIPPCDQPIVGTYNEYREIGGSD